MLKRHIHFLPACLQFPHRLFDCRIPARVALLPQAFPDPLGCVSLLARHPIVFAQNLFNPLPICADLRLRPRLGQPVSLLQRPPVHPRPPQHLPPTHPLHQNFPPYLTPLFHICVHAPFFPRRCRTFRAPFHTNDPAAVFKRRLQQFAPASSPDGKRLVTADLEDHTLLL